MANLYYYDAGAGGYAWNYVASWYFDAARTLPAGRIPANGDDVEIQAGSLIISGPSVAVNLNSVLVNCLCFNLNNITSSAFTFYAYMVSGSIIGTATFYDCQFGGTITGTANFNSTSNPSCGNSGTVNGTAVFNGFSSNVNAGVVNGAAIFNDDSANEGSLSSASAIYGTAIFNDRSTNEATIEGYAEFYDTSSNIQDNAYRWGRVMNPGDCIFGLGSTNQGIFYGALATVGGSAVFAGSLIGRSGYLSPTFLVESGSSDVLITGIE